jgi:hypothetical protein
LLDYIILASHYFACCFAAIAMDIEKRAYVSFSFAFCCTGLSYRVFLQKNMENSLPIDDGDNASGYRPFIR